MKQPKIRLHLLDPIAGQALNSDLVLVEREVSTGVFVSYKATKSQLSSEGAYVVAQSVELRNAISEDARIEGMLCYVISEEKTYRLVDGIENSNWEEVLGGSATAASQVSYINSGYPSISNVEQALNQLLYVSPIISGMSNSVGTVMIGTTITSISLSWSYNKTMTTASLNQGIGSISAGATSYNHTGLSVTTDRTYTLTAGDGTNTATANTSISFRSPRFWGSSASTSLNNAGIQALSNELSSNRTQSRTITLSNQYIYFAWPTSFGQASFTVNGLTNTAWNLSTVSFTNAAGHTQNYYVYRSTNLLTGTFTVGVT